MANAEQALHLRARRAYETGRALRGLRRAALVAPMAALSLLACGRPAASLIVAVLLTAAVAFGEWRGEGIGRGARIGLWAGLPALLVPVLIQTTGHVCGASFCKLYPTLCLLGGLAAGALLVTGSLRREVSRQGVFVAGVVACLVGALGCLIGGVSGLVGLVFGLALGAVPVLALRRA